jgi:2-polyprenyl-3-methyl-5-hydroxy-6-metoxy-1,4-benzoquinol methylase
MHPKADYDRIAPQWAIARRELPPLDAALFERWFEGLPAGARVLDLGCGAAIPIAKTLADRGVQVVGVDCSRRMIEMARAQVPSGEFFLGDIEDLEVEGPFDGVVLFDAIFHIERENHAAILRAVHSRLAPQGSLLITSGGSEQPPFTDTMFGEEFFYDALSPEAFFRTCLETGFEPVAYSVLNEPDGGRDKGRIGVVYRKSMP